MCISIIERDAVKSTLLESLLSETDYSLRRVLTEIITKFTQVDYPTNWPSLMPLLQESVQSADFTKIYNSLYALRKIIKRYEFKQNEARQPLEELMRMWFPYLQNLMHRLVSENSLEAAEVMKICIKIVHSCVFFQLPADGCIDMDVWFMILKTILNKHLPEASEGLEPFGQPVHIEERNAWSWWKLKKWAARVTFVLMERYGNPHRTGDENQSFAAKFRETISVQLLEPVMNTLNARAAGRFVTDDVYRMCLGFMVVALEMAPTFQHIKTNIDFVLFQVIFPTLCLKSGDAELFDEDPHEFIRRFNDENEAWLDPRAAAINLLQGLGRYRLKYTLPIFMPYLEKILTEYNSVPMELRDHTMKDGALVCVAYLAEVLHRHDKTFLPSFFSTHVLPEFQSPVGYLRARACWMVGYFDQVRWSSEEAGAILTEMLRCLRDPSIPVQHAAAASMKTLISSKEVKEFIRPILPDIIREYFRIIHDVDSPESVLDALQTFVEVYGQDIEGVAVEMAQQLSVVHSNYSSDGKDIDDDYMAMTASRALDIILVLIEKFENRPDVLVEVEKAMIPTMAKIVSGEGACLEYLDPILEMLKFFAYSVQETSPALLSFCGPLLKSMHEWAEDYSHDILTVLVILITKDPLSFSQGSYLGMNNLDMLLPIIQKAITNVGADEDQPFLLAKFLSTLAVSSKGLLTTYIPVFMNTVLMRLVNPCTEQLIMALVETMCALMYCDTVVFLETISSGNFHENFFSMLIQELGNIAKENNVRTKKLMILSLTSFLVCPKDKLPSIVAANMNVFFSFMVNFLFTTASENSGKEKKGFDGYGDEFEAEGDFNEFALGQR